ncbi:hypothetical protein [Aestuariibaculum sediminum]|uniref:Uncharacterized protein n=1 Tax=Aestuariibaculum sediminum TaxID=2770637 RepID=A0A8J6Q7J3_9FLAO|nr:hypothetical protein [Aestuariibaculum sediminum]MBD0832623.1 hypothetical protein [Aestuariibaculum sediminum]
MFKLKIIEGLVMIIYILSVLFQFTGHEHLAYYSSSLIIPVITIVYFLRVDRKSLFFSLFLVCFSISDLLVFLEDIQGYNKIDYFLGNGLYILSYIFLILEICKSLNFKYVIKNYIIHLLVLTVLSVYIVFALQNTVVPYVSAANEYCIELIYNIVLLTMLSFALLGYFYKDNVKALYLFLGVLCVVFAEVIWVAYTYISERNLLNVLSTTLYLIGFYFFYKQSKLLEEQLDSIEIV